MFKVVICILLCMMFTLPVSAEPISPDTEALVQTIWQSQTIDGLSNGIWVIPEGALNEYFTNSISNEKVKNPQLKLLDNNRITFTFDSSLRRVALTGEIKKFVHNQTDSYIEVYIREKKTG